MNHSSNQSFRDFVIALQSKQVAADEIFETQESVTMKFTRATLEAVAEQAEAILGACQNILEVLPDDCEVTADVDYFTPAVANVSYKAKHGRFPALPIGSDVIALNVALDDFDEAVEAITP